MMADNGKSSFDNWTAVGYVAASVGAFLVGAWKILAGKGSAKEDKQTLIAHEMQLHDAIEALQKDLDKLQRELESFKEYDRAADDYRIDLLRSEIQAKREILEDRFKERFQNFESKMRELEGGIHGLEERIKTLIDEGGRRKRDG